MAPLRKRVWFRASMGSRIIGRFYYISTGNFVKKFQQGKSILQGVGEYWFTSVIVYRCSKMYKQPYRKNSTPLV